MEPVTALPLADEVSALWEDLARLGTAFPQVRGVVRMGWPVGRVLSPGPSRSPGGDHPSTRAVADPLQRSTRVLGRAALERTRARCP